MKKNNFYVLGLLAMVLAFGFVFVGCDTGDTGTDDKNTDPKSIKITGIVNPSNTKENVEISLSAGNWSQQVAQGDSDIVNQTLVVDLYSVDAQNDRTQNRWTGNGEWYIRILFWDDTVDKKGYDYLLKNQQKYNIKDAVTELSFSDFVAE
jgi:hypothetical protein